MNDPTELQSLLDVAGPTPPPPTPATNPSLGSMLAAPQTQMAQPKAPAPAPAAPTDTTFPDPMANKSSYFAQNLSKAMQNPANGKMINLMGRLAEPPSPAAPAGAGSTNWDIAQAPEDEGQPANQPAAAPTGVRGAIYKALSGVNNGLAGMGDMAGGIRMNGAGGALGGFAGTAEAQGKRMSEQMKDKQLIATSNAQMLHEQALTHKMGEDTIMESVKDGKAAFDNVMNPGPGGVAATPIAVGKTAAELSQMIAGHELKPTEETVFLTGRTPTGKKDANGQPIMSSTYSVVKLAGNINISPENAKLMNENLGTNYSTDPDNPQVLPAAQFNNQLQRAQSAKITMKALAVTDAAGNKVLEDEATHKASQTIGQNPLITRMMADPTYNSSKDPANPDPYAKVKVFNAITNGAIDPTTKKPYNQDKSLPPNFADVWVDSQHGAAVWDEQVKEYAKSQEKGQVGMATALKDVEANPAVMGEHPDAYITIFDTLGADTNQTPEVRAQAKQYATIARSVQSNQEETKRTEAGDKKKAEDTASLEDTDQLVTSALAYDLDPEKMFGIRSGQRAEFMNKVMTAAKDRGIPWTERDYRARYLTAQQFTPEGAGGKQVISLNTFTGHAGDAFDLIHTLPNTNVKLYNMAMNKWQSDVEGKDQYPKMQAALAAVGREYMNFLNNGHAATVQDQALADSLVNGNMSPKALDGVIKQMANTVAIRGGALQEAYTRTMATSYKDMLAPESNDILNNKFGINTDKMNAIPASATAAAKTNPAPNAKAPVHSPDIQRPADIPTATGTSLGADGKQYWTNIANKRLRLVTPAEQAQIDQGEKK